MANQTTLAQIEIPPNAPLVPEWAREAVRALNLLITATVATAPSSGLGANAFAFGGSNSTLLLPGGFTGRIALAKLTTGGAVGYIDVKDGRVTFCLQPS